MHYVGCDAHKRTSFLQHMDEQGALGLSGDVPTTKAHLHKFLDQIDQPVRITFEASSAYFWLYQVFSEHPQVKAVSVVDSRRSRQFAEGLSVNAGYGRAKNDRIDAEMLAEQDRRGLAPAIGVPTEEQLRLRTMVRHRFQLQGIRTRYINQVHAHLAMHGQVCSFSKLLAEADYRKEKFDALPIELADIIEDYLDFVRLLDRRRQRIEERLFQALPPSHPEIKRLMTTPGIGQILAWVISTEIFDIKHFKSQNNLRSYAGIAPMEHVSNDKRTKAVKLNKNCNYYLKYAFIEAAHHARTHERYKRKYALDVKRLGKVKAKINLARRLANAVYWMMVHQEDFKPHGSKRHR